MSARRLDTHGIPMDPDAESRGVPVRQRAADMVVVFVGGAAGATLRYLVALITPSPGGLPIGTLVPNVLGAFVLGLLLEMLALGGRDAGVRRRVRLGVGTGLLGGFTTYSSFAVETATLGGGDHVLLAVAYAVGTVLLGVLAAALGMLVVRRSVRG